MSCFHKWLKVIQWESLVPTISFPSNCEKSFRKCKLGKYRVIKPILPGVWKYGGIIVSKIAQIVKKTEDSSVQALTMSKFKFG